MLLPSECPKAVRDTERLCKDLKQGRILGSTEAACKTLDTLTTAAGECGKLFNSYLIEWVPRIIESRPTSLVMINLTREFLERYLEALREGGVDEALGRVKDIVDSIKRHVSSVRDAVASLGSRRISDGDVILTHSYSSTIINLLRKALERGVTFSVYVTESRPIGEGLITAEALSRMGIKTILVVDSAVRFVMKKVNKVVVGADAVAANGAVVNKIGTSLVALAAKEARVRVYVAAGTYKFGFETVFGELIEGVMLNDPNLIIPCKEWVEKLAGRVVAREPLFDVTPPEYIDAIITEHGLVAPQAIPILMKGVYGWPPRVKSIESILKEVQGVGGLQS